jgi:hypothetical protein
LGALGFGKETARETDESRDLWENRAVNAKRPEADFSAPGVNWFGISFRRKKKAPPTDAQRNFFLLAKIRGDALGERKIYPSKSPIRGIGKLSRSLFTTSHRFACSKMS